MVEKEKIMQCIEAARLSPSACNSQPWTFVVIDNDSLRESVEKAATSLGMNKFVTQAPIIVAIVLEKPNLTSKIGSVMKDKEYTLIDIGIAANQFCLQAAELGLGTCMIGWFDEKKVKKLLDVPSSKRIPLLISLGYSNSNLREKTRKSIDKMYKQNKY
jgi:nitroreductase